MIAGSVLKGSYTKGFKASCKATTATDHLKTPQKTHGDPIMTPSPCARNLAETFQQREVRFNEGYNSEGELGPFSSVVEIEGKQDFEEEALPQQREYPLDGSDLLGPSDTGMSNAAAKDTFLIDAAREQPTLTIQVLHPKRDTPTSWTLPLEWLVAIAMRRNEMLPAEG
jgi:hypothetical protein